MAVSSKFAYGVSATPARGDHLERINIYAAGTNPHDIYGQGKSGSPGN